MRVNKNKWLYKAAYFNPNQSLPSEISFLSFLWRLPYGVFAAWPLGFAGIGLIALFGYLALGLDKIRGQIETG